MSRVTTLSRRSKQSWREWPLSDLLAMRDELRRMGSSGALEWQRRYESDPVGFVQNHLRFDAGEHPADYQLDALRSLVEHDRVALRGPRGLGKSSTAAWAILWWSLVWDGRTDWKIITTASVWRQLTSFLWPEVHKWAARVRDVPGRAGFSDNELMLTSLRLTTGEAQAIASNNAELMEGAHASKLLYIFDESKIIPRDVWDSVEGAFASGGGKWLALSTPGVPSGKFYEIMSGQAQGWHRIRVTMEEAVAAGRVDAEWVKARQSDWAETDPRYQQYVLGEFAADDEAGIIPLSWVEAAVSRWREWDDSGRDGKGVPAKVTGIAWDVGGGAEGGDASVIAIVYDYRYVGELIKIPTATDESVSTMELTGRIAQLLKMYSPEWAIGDGIGIGAGVIHRLRELGFNVHAFIAGASTNLKDRSGLMGYANCRAAGWYCLRDMLDPVDGVGIALPPDDELVGDLTAPQDGGVTSRGDRLVEKKDSIRRRLGRSTDCGDAVMQGLAGPLMMLLDRERTEVVYNPVRIGRY